MVITGPTHFINSLLCCRRFYDVIVGLCSGKHWLTPAAQMDLSVLLIPRARVLIISAMFRWLVPTRGRCKQPLTKAGKSHQNSSSSSNGVILHKTVCICIYGIKQDLTSIFIADISM